MNWKKVKKKVSLFLAMSMLCSSINLNVMQVRAEEGEHTIIDANDLSKESDDNEQQDSVLETLPNLNDADDERSIAASNDYIDPNIEDSIIVEEGSSITTEIKEEEEIKAVDSLMSETKSTIWVVGDSTVSSFEDPYFYPRYGWGTQLEKYFDNGRFEIKNIALSGRSSKSYLTEPEYQTLLSEVKEGDYLFIGFGHNDEKKEGGRYTNPNGNYLTEGSFANSLYENYIKQLVEKGCTPVLMTPIVRRSATGVWTEEQLHITATSGNFEGGDYSQAVRNLGHDVSVAVVDLTTLTKHLYEELGSSETLNLHAWTSYKPDSVDNTHTNIWGATYNAYFIAKTIKELNIEGLSEYIIASTIETTPSKEQHLYSNPNYVISEYDNDLKDSELWEDIDVWKGTVFGNVGVEPSTDDFYLGKDSEGNMQISVKHNKGKIASTVDGLAMYYYKVPVGSTFTLTAIATINDYFSNDQVSFGLMARDDMYIDTNRSDAMGDYVAVAPLRLTKKGLIWNSFARKDGNLIQGGTVENPINSRDSIDLKLEGSSDGYAATFGKEQTITGGFDFPLTSVDSEYVYVGMFAARHADITFSQIKLIVDGVEVTGSSSSETQISKVLNVSELDHASLNEDLDLDDFVIKATSDKGVTIENNTKLSDSGINFTKRLKLNGTGAESYRSIYFSTTQEATVNVYALSGSTGKSRSLDIYKQGTADLVASLPAVDEVSGKIILSSTTLPEAGDYYIASPDSGVNLYYLEVVSCSGGDDVERPSWDLIENPVITHVQVNDESKDKVDVSWEMVMGQQGADKLEVKLIDSVGNVVDSQITKKDATFAVVQLTPPTSGSYSIVAEASRQDEVELKVSDVMELNDFIRPLQPFNIIKAATAKDHSLDIEWESVAEAQYYTVEMKEESSDKYTLVTKETTETSLNIPSLTVGVTYVIKVTAVRGVDRVEATITKQLEAEAEIWSVGNIGSGAAGTITKNDDGSITIAASGGKIADSEDGFTFYYTKLDPITENFTLTATFKVDATRVGGKTYDGQSGFGVMAIDTIEIGNSNARYYNSAGSVFARYKDGATTYNGIPGGRFVTGYTENPSTPTSDRKLVNTQAFDWNFNSENQPNTSKPHYFDGEIYTLTLRKSNTGYHAILNNDATNEVIYYDYDNELLTAQESDAIYVGVMASRGVQVTVSDMELTLISPEDDEEVIGRPTEYITPTITTDTTKTTPDQDYDLSLRSNLDGTVSIIDSKGNKIHENISLEASQRLLKSLTLKQGANQFKVEFTPSKEQPSLESYQELSSYETITLIVNISCQSFGTNANVLYVSTIGTNVGEGTKTSPLDIYTAIAYAQPGQEIVLLEGIYDLTQAIIIDRGRDGTPEEMITLMAEPGKNVVIDLAQSPKGGFMLNADYWHFFGFEIRNSQDNAKPLLIQGHHNIIEQLKVYSNGATGVQISGLGSEKIDMWPSYNLIQSVESYNNMDSNANDADGFAAKITTGVGNIFRHCISHHNIDDGWDLYAKSTSGSIGQVIVESSIAYENGYLTTDPDKTIVGEGNGFKLGGESMPGDHILRNSISFNNYAKGVTSNSGPDVQVYNTLSFNNGGQNLSLYTAYKTTNYKLDHFISYNGGKADEITLKGQESLTSPTNYIKGVNSKGEVVPSSWFENVDLTFYPTINEKGGFDFNGLETVLNHTEEFLGIMATNKTEATIITVGTEIGSDDSTENPVIPEKPSYVIPELIKDAIDTTIMTPTGGDGTVSKPLFLTVSNQATVSDIKAMFNKFAGYTIKVSLLSISQSELQYVLQLNNRSETISLILTILSTQQDIRDYLDSFIEDSNSTQPDNGGNNHNNNNGSNNTNNSNSLNHSTKILTTTKPETGYSQLMGWMLAGTALIIIGYVSYLIYKKKGCNRTK